MLPFEQILDAGTHLAGGFVCECDCENIVWRNMLFGDQIGDAHGYYTRLTRTGAGEN